MFDQQTHVNTELDRVEAVLRETVSSDQPLIGDAASYLIVAGGKRLRPMLVLLVGTLGDVGDERLVPCAAAIELTHLASLYHDDVIDETTVRRGVPTANARYDNNVAVLTGDFLFARASGLAATLGTYVSKRLADTIAVLCEGQIMETAAAERLDVTAAHYLDVIERKTASLIATSCHLGAWLANASAGQVEAATEFGRALGMAFQLADDVLDIAGEQQESGKVPGTDLREGVLTLPALATLGGEVPGADALRAALERNDVEAALQVLRTNGSVEVARVAVGEWQAHARTALGRLPEGSARDALDRLVDFVGARTG